MCTCLHLSNTLAGRIGPEYESLELNIGGSVVSSALCEVCGVSRSQLREMYRQHGDLGDVAQASADRVSSCCQVAQLAHKQRMAVAPCRLAKAVAGSIALGSAQLPCLSVVTLMAGLLPGIVV